MKNGINKFGMKLRRILYRIGKASMFVITVITCYNLTKHLIELRQEKLRKLKNKKTTLAVLTVLGTFSVIAIAFAVILKYIKLLKKGYILDLFDTEAYDVIEPEEEFPAESCIKSELSIVEDAADHEKLFAQQIPLDDEASEENYNN